VIEKNKTDTGQKDLQESGVLFHLKRRKLLQIGLTGTFDRQGLDIGITCINQSASAKDPAHGDCEKTDDQCGDSQSDDPGNENNHSDAQDGVGQSCPHAIIIFVYFAKTNVYGGLARIPGRKVARISNRFGNDLYRLMAATHAGVGRQVRPMRQVENLVVSPRWIDCWRWERLLGTFHVSIRWDYDPQILFQSCIGSLECKLDFVTLEVEACHGGALSWRAVGSGNQEDAASGLLDREKEQDCLCCELVDFWRDSAQDLKSLIHQASPLGTNTRWN